MNKTYKEALDCAVKEDQQFFSGSDTWVRDGGTFTRGSDFGKSFSDKQYENIICKMEEALIRLKYNRNLEIEETETGGVPHRFENIADAVLIDLKEFRNKNGK